MRVHRVGLIGIGGFGLHHVRLVKHLVEEGRLQCAAFAEIRPDAHPQAYADLTAMGAVHYTDYEQMLAAHPELDFVVISTPIATHKPMAVRAMEMGFHVLVEKPPAVTIQDIDEMIAAQRRTGRLCQVDFQNTSGEAFRKLLELLQAGELGRVEEVAGIGMWRRTLSYYARTGWAGKLVHDGSLVLDGTFINPLAHLLHNCLLAAGSGRAAAAEPASVQAELYHANAIEGDDTSCLRITAANGVTVYFYATLCHTGHDLPHIEVRGAEGRAVWSYDNKLVVHGTSGEAVHDFGEGPLGRNMYLNLMAAIDNPDVALFAPIDDCRSYVLAANGAYESARIIRSIPERWTTRATNDSGDISVLVPSLTEHLREAAERRLLFAEYAPLEWAAPSEPFRLWRYDRFELPATMASSGERE